MFSTKFDENRKLWYGGDIPVEHESKISLGQALLNSMRVFGSKVGQINDNDGNQLLFDEIRMKTIQAAQNLQALGYQQNQVFGFLVGNQTYVAPLAFATIAIGCAICPFDPTLEKRELLEKLNIIKPVLMFCEVKYCEMLKECLMELEIKAKIFVFEDSPSRFDDVEDLFAKTHKENQFTPTQVDVSNQMAIIHCTDDTSAACISHAVILNSIAERFIPCNSNDVMLCTSSLHRFSCLSTLLRSTLYGATRVITTESFTPDLQLRLVEKYKVTFIFNTPIEIALMVKCDKFHQSDLTSVKYALVSGGPTPLRIKSAFNQRLQQGSIHTGYELSDLGSFMAIDYPASSSSTLRLDTVVGRLGNGCSIKIIDDRGNPCGVNVPGEIHVKINSKSLGFYCVKNSSDEDRFGAEGYFHSGDIGSFDSDGNLHIIDKQSELLRYLNYYVSPSEIDTYLIGKPDIQLACVVGITNDEFGDLPAAAIIRTHRSNSITENDVQEMVADHFDDHYKLRGGVYFVDELPFGSSGKINRQLVKEIVTELFNERSC